ENAMGTAHVLQNILILLVALEGFVLLTAIFSDLKAYSPKLSDPQSWSPTLKLAYLYAEAVIHLTAFLTLLGSLYVVYRGETGLTSFVQPAVIWLVITNPIAQRRALQMTKLINVGIWFAAFILLLLGVVIRGA